jgi:hypothetical protein
MKAGKYFLTLAIAVLFTALFLHAQRVDSIRFFTAEPVIEMTLTTDIKALQSQKGEDVFQPGTVSMKFPDSSLIEEPVNVGARGNFRRGYCRIPPIMIDFRHTDANRLSSLGKLKLVIGCGAKDEDEQLLLKEFLIYKIYNLLEEKSFRVRLLKTTYNDTKNRVKAFTQYSFLIEDDADMAKRNGCKKKDHPSYLTESTNRDLMTKVAIFEYMIGNTDWSVPNTHNIKLIFARKDEQALPFAVPYDFDYCGLVDASYAIPNEVIGTEKITERVYRGFPRTMEELQQSLALFRDKKSAIYSLINGFTLITERNRKIMISYLDDFYKTINNENSVKNIFIDKARTN